MDFDWRPRPATDRTSAAKFVEAQFAQPNLRQSLSQSVGPQQRPVLPEITTFQLASYRPVAGDTTSPVRASPTSATALPSRASLIPSFLPATAASTPQVGATGQSHPASPSADIRQSLRLGFDAAGMDGRYPTIGATSPGARVDAAESSSPPVGAGASGRSPAPASPPIEGLPDSMVGVGRNSVILMAQSPPAPSAVSPSFAAAGPSNPRPAAAPPAVAGPSAPAPPHLVPQAEICVECMMRDRDMADVDVTGEGVWARESDRDFEEALRWEDDEDDVLSSGYGPRGGAGASEEGGGAATTTLAHITLDGRAGHSRSGDNHSIGSRESGSLLARYAGPSMRRRIGRGQPLTEASLKLWTSMVRSSLSRASITSLTESAPQNPSATSHRWRTLQIFLAQQLENLERYGQEAREREYELSRATARQEAAEMEARSKMHLRGPSVAQEEAPGFAYATSPNASVLSFQLPEQPWLQSHGRRSSTPGLRDNAPSPTGRSFGPASTFVRSSTDLRTSQARRSQSPGGMSLGLDPDGRRTSAWSRFRRSASQSLLSLAPSGGSMMDMHLGLAQEREVYAHRSAPYDSYPSASDPFIARHAEAERTRALAAAAADHQATRNGKPRKKGIKGFFKKLVGHSGQQSSKAHSARSVPTTPQVAYDDGDDEDILMPPPPLLALANEPRYHARSRSNSSLDSLQQPFAPYSLPNRSSSSGMPIAGAGTAGGSYRSSVGSPPRQPGAFGGDFATRPVDRRSVLSNGSNTMRSGMPEREHRAMQMQGEMQLQNCEYLQQPIAELAESTNPGRHEGTAESDAAQARAMQLASLRKEKSLPSLPSEAHHKHMYDASQMPRMPTTELSRVRTGQSQSSIPLENVDDGTYTLGGGRKSKARSRVWTLGFPGGSHSARSRSDPNNPHAHERDRTEASFSGGHSRPRTPPALADDEGVYSHDTPVVVPVSVRY